MAVSFGPAARARRRRAARQPLDAAFWALSGELSEPNGYFQSDNLVSNEIQFQHVIPDLAKSARGRPRLSRRRAGAELQLHRGAQAGDGLHRRRPARQPAAAPDVQGAVRAVGRSRGVRVAAVLEEAAGRPDRARRRRRRSSRAYEKVETDARSSTRRTSPAIDDHLVKTRGLPLTDGRPEGDRVRLLPVLLVRPVDSVLVDGRQRARRPERADVRRSDDGRRRRRARARSFLASEENFTLLKELETKNLLVPVVGNFAGPKALRGVGGVRPRSRRDRLGVLPLERRAVSGAQRDLGAVLRQRRDDAARTSRARSSARCGAATSSRASDSTRSWATWSAKRSRAAMTGAARLLFRSGVLGRPLVAQPPAPSRR